MNAIRSEPSHNWEEVFFRILDQIPTLFVITDPDGRIQHVNRTFVDKMEYTLDELKGNITFFNAQNAEGARVREEITRAMQQDGFWRGDMEVVSKSGKHLWIRGLLFTVKKSDDTVIGVAAYNDISDEIRLMQEQSEKQQMLIQKSRLESLGEMAAGLAHEINQPLSVISLVMENIQYKMEQGRTTKAYFKRKFGTIQQNLTKLQQLTEHIRIFSRDHSVVHYDRIDVNKCIRGALSMVGEQLHNHQIRVVTDLGNGHCYTLGSASRFEQVILNLLTNARDALEEKEKRSIFVDDGKEIRISTRGEDDHLVVSIRDNGTGIPPENQQRLFNPFFTTKEEGKGTGLGLPIVYGIIQEMKGEIRVTSQVDEFTEMTIQLPRYRSKAPKKRNP
ncbi:MAG TPA: ATP-binding protein [Bacteroidales bacterium]|nr:ATP-binding protein [Bacteroidales bacterium]